jgi:hypothetical protein
MSRGGFGSITAGAAAWRLGLIPAASMGRTTESWAKLKTYYLQDQNPQLNQTATAKRCSHRHVSAQPEDGRTLPRASTVSLTSPNLSDQYVMQDFYQGEFRVNPVPDNVVALTKTDPRLHADRHCAFSGERVFRAQRNVCRRSCWDIQASCAFWRTDFLRRRNGAC